MTTDRELLQQALDLLNDINQCSLPPTGIPLPAEIDHVMEALCARLAQPEQEPAAYMDMYGQVYNPHELNGELRIRYLMKMQDAPTPLYYAPPQREWVGLTDEEIEKIEMSASSILSAIYLAEAQLKGKNA